MDISKFVRKPVKEMYPIQWGETKYDSSYIVLKWGENPYPPSNRIKNDIKKLLGSINRYPYLMNELKNKLAEYAGCKRSQICITNGADKAFRLISEVFINPGDETITFTPSYPVFDESIKMMGGKVIKVPLNKKFKVSNLNVLKKYFSNKTKIIYICNPNNPTGNFIISNKKIKQLLELNLIVIVDEAYFEFSGKTAAGLLIQYDNLIILRSFSKTFGLAGLRVAYMLSSPKIIDYSARIEDSLEIFNISTPSLAGALSALKYFREIKENIKKINNSKKLLVKKLGEFNISTYPSFTSFQMFNLKNVGIKTKDFIEKLTKQKIIIKDVSIYSGLSEFDAYMAIPRQDQLSKVSDSILKIIKDLS